MNESDVMLNVVISLVKARMSYDLTDAELYKALKIVLCLLDQQ